MRKAGIHFEEADYVRLYCEDTPGWKLLSPPAQMIYPLIRRKLNSAGLLDLGGEECARAVAATLGWSEQWVRFVDQALDELLGKKWLVYSETYDSLIDPDFDESEHAKKTEAFRKRQARRKRAEQAAMAGLEKAQEIRDANRASAGQRVLKTDDASGSGTRADEGRVRKTDEASENGTRSQLRLLEKPRKEPSAAVRDTDEASLKRTRRPENGQSVRKRTEASPFFLLPSPSAFSPQAAAAAGGGGERKKTQRFDDDRAATPESIRHGAAALHPHRAAEPVYASAVAEPQGKPAPVVAEPQGFTGAAALQPSAAAVHAFARNLEPDPADRSDPASGFLAEAESLSRRLWSRGLKPNEIEIIRRWCAVGFESSETVAAIEKRCGMREDGGQLRLLPPIDAKGKEVQNLAWFDGPVRDAHEVEQSRQTESWEIPASPQQPETLEEPVSPDDAAARYRGELVDRIMIRWRRSQPSRGEEATIREWFKHGVDLAFIDEFLRDPPDIGGEPARYLTAYRGKMLSARQRIAQLQAPAYAAAAPPPTTDAALRLTEIAESLPRRLLERARFAAEIRSLVDVEDIDESLEELETEVLRALHGSLTPDEEAELSSALEAAFAKLSGRLCEEDREAAKVRMYCQLLRSRFELPVFSIL